MAELLLALSFDLTRYEFQRRQSLVHSRMIGTGYDNPGTRLASDYLNFATCVLGWP